ncbi:Uma2 family endonuclease [Candidatus Saccharibacteria bacterium]|nr:Uma2 family endonuclease [Candidatus Saccharibacteria bacterium]NIW79074.1 hypothetical protein [Calditrichia bacterium]
MQEKSGDTMTVQLVEKKKWQYKDYARLDDENRYEVIEGELVMAPSPATRHQFISGELDFKLRDFVKKHQIGTVFHAPLDVILSPPQCFPTEYFVH